MSNKILTISICAVIGGVVLLGIGYLTGVSIEKQKTGSQLENLEKITGALRSLSFSKVVPSITATGKVTKISGRNVTLTQEGESIEVFIKEDAKISSFNAPASDQETPPTGSVQTQNTFEAIKVGDNLSVRVKVLPNGQIEGSWLVII